MTTLFPPTARSTFPCLFVRFHFALTNFPVLGLVPPPFRFLVIGGPFFFSVFFRAPPAAQTSPPPSVFLCPFRRFWLAFLFPRQQQSTTKTPFFSYNCSDGLFFYIICHLFILGLPDALPFLPLFNSPFAVLKLRLPNPQCDRFLFLGCFFLPLLANVLPFCSPGRNTVFPSSPRLRNLLFMFLIRRPRHRISRVFEARFLFDFSL